MKIAVYSICKNEEAFVDRFLDSCEGADLVLVADTGSTDNTWNNFARRQAGPTRIELQNISISPWRFDLARNTALALLPADVDVCIRLDLDEVLDPGWRVAIEEAWVEGTTMLWYPFKHAPDFIYQLNYVHARHGYVWKGSDHEALFDVSGKGRTRYTDRLSITHLQDRTKDRSSILPRLVAQVKEDKRARTLYYLGREYYYYQLNTDAIATLKEYLAQPDATWDAERMDVMSMIAESYERTGNIGVAIQWFHKAIAECTVREPMIGLAALLQRVNNKELALGLAQHALRLPHKMPNIYQRQSAWNATPYEIAAECAADLGWHDKAQEHMRAAEAAGHFVRSDLRARILG